ncbi:MAG: T9SS type A sorting domain-containing protein [Melioribacteraceae bacterium]|nr:T9SS type A sorting domain-containing protein [Melioribacteraceae bacterium]MCF8266412.1 T9SS type A sorting domain-containing protein [Melioribacteraceae bacterium]MCF8413390.1 T9SS type A sorting domain-containing protein [Melioribacteraceae bacterium]
MKKTIILLILGLTQLVSAQWSSEWISNSVTAENVSGWLAFKQIGDETIYRYYIIDYTSISIMESPYSDSPEYSYTFSAAEQLAGNEIYALGDDLTGDGITEFYSLLSYGTTDSYRQAFKIIDITTGNTVFEQDNASYYFTYPAIWDIDGDNILECSFARYDYPNFTNYTYFVFNTGVVSSSQESVTGPINFSLKQNFPNPFNPSTTIQYNLPFSSSVNVTIYDINGRIIKRLFDGIKQQGSHQIEWNGKSDKNIEVSSGTYFYEIKTDKGQLIKKMQLIK